MEKTTLLKEALLRTQPENIVKEVIEMLKLVEQQEKEEKLRMAQQTLETEANLNAAWENAWLY